MFVAQRSLLGRNWCDKHGMVHQIVLWRFVELAHLVSRFPCNTRVIVDASSNTPVYHANCCKKNLESIHQVNKQTLRHQSITQMIIR